MRGNDKAPKGVQVEAMNLLFDYCCSRINKELIEKYCPGDPGYKDYVREWSKVLETRTVPSVSNFDISETVSLTDWSEDLEEGFLRFRCFTNSVAVQMMCIHGQEKIVFHLNYPLVRLFADSIQLRDKQLMLNLADAVHEASAACRNGQWHLIEYVPWCHFTELLIAALRDEATVEQLAERVVASDAQLRRDEHQYNVVHPAAVLGLTNFDTLHGLWQSLGSQLLTPYMEVGWVGLLLTSLSEYPVTIRTTPNVDNELLRLFRN